MMYTGRFNKTSESDYKQEKEKKQKPRQVINRKGLARRAVHKLEEQKRRAASAKEKEW